MRGWAGRSSTKRDLERRRGRERGAEAPGASCLMLSSAASFGITVGSGICQQQSSRPNTEVPPAGHNCYIGPCIAQDIGVQAAVVNTHAWNSSALHSRISLMGKGPSLTVQGSL